MLLQWGSYAFPSREPLVSVDYEERDHVVIQRNLYSLCLNEHLYGP